jgi:hypothetical protein
MLATALGHGGQDDSLVPPFTRRSVSPSRHSTLRLVRGSVAQVGRQRRRHRHVARVDGQDLFDERLAGGSLRESTRTDIGA